MKNIAYQVKEKKRKYTFVGATVELEDVEQIIITDSNNHRINTSDGLLHIIPPKWIHIEIESDGIWVF